MVEKWADCHIPWGSKHLRGCFRMFFWGGWVNNLHRKAGAIWTLRDCHETKYCFQKCYLVTSWFLFPATSWKQNCMFFFGGGMLLETAWPSTKWPVSEVHPETPHISFLIQTFKVASTMSGNRREAQEQPCKSKNISYENVLFFNTLSPKPTKPTRQDFGRKLQSLLFHPVLDLDSDLLATRCFFKTGHIWPWFYGEVDTYFFHVCLFLK